VDGKEEKLEEERERRREAEIEEVEIKTHHSPLPIHRRLGRKVQRNGEDVNVGELVGEFSSKVLKVGPV